MSIKFKLKKEGMTSVNVGSDRIPVTLLSFDDHVVVQVKTTETDGYSAVQIATGKNAKHPNKPQKGHYEASKVAPTKHLFECRLDDIADLDVGSQIGFDTLEGWVYVDVQSISKGKGFTGVMKAWNFAGQRATHGVSLAHRKPGSIGQCQDPGRVFKGKKMARRHGAETKTIHALKVISIDAENRTIAIKGSVPGSNGSYVFLKQSTRKKDKRGQ